MKKNNAIVFGLTSNHVFAVACMMMGLKKFSRDSIDEVVIIHDGINKRDMELLGSILPVRFVLYEPLLSEHVLESASVKQFTRMVFSKYECLRLLDEYRNVVWLDYDMVIQGDISELFERCESGVKMMPGGLPVRGQLNAPVDEFDMDAEGMCSCVIVFQDHLKLYREMREFCYAQTEKYADVLFMPEQAIFDFMVQNYDLKPEPIDGKRYSPHPTDAVYAPHAKIIHAYAQPKFWNGLHDNRWDENYRSWLKMGGSKYRMPTRLDKWKNKIKRLGVRLGVGG